MTEQSNAILVVDDDEINRDLMVRLFARYRPHDEVVCAGSGREALEQARMRRPHLVLLDINLPDVGGEELLGLFKQEHAVPVVMLSAHADNETRRRLTEQGADAYLTKPVVFGELFRVVESLIRLTSPDSD